MSIQLGASPSNMYSTLTCTHTHTRTHTHMLAHTHTTTHVHNIGMTLFPFFFCFVFSPMSNLKNLMRGEASRQLQHVAILDTQVAMYTYVLFPWPGPSPVEQVEPSSFQREPVETRGSWPRPG